MAARAQEMSARTGEGVEALLGSCAPRRHDEEDGPQHYLHFREHLMDGRELSHVVPAERGVNLNRQLDFIRVADDAQGSLEAAGDLSKIVVGDSIGTVQADGEAMKARLLEPAKDLGSDQRRRRWRHCHL